MFTLNHTLGRPNWGTEFHKLRLRSDFNTVIPVFCICNWAVLKNIHAILIFCCRIPFIDNFWTTLHILNILSIITWMADWYRENNYNPNLQYTRILKIVYCKKLPKKRLYNFKKIIQNCTRPAFSLTKERHKLKGYEWFNWMLNG